MMLFFVASFLQYCLHENAARKYENDNCTSSNGCFSNVYKRPESTNGVQRKRHT